MGNLRLTEAAATDLEEIALYGLQNFGARQTLRYRDGLKIRLTQIAETPLLYPAVDHIRPGYRRSVYECHVVYYKIDAQGGVVIVRILGQQDALRRLPE